MLIRHIVQVQDCPEEKDGRQDHVQQSDDKTEAAFGSIRQRAVRPLRLTTVSICPQLKDQCTDNEQDWKTVSQESRQSVFYITHPQCYQVIGSIEDSSILTTQGRKPVVAILISIVEDVTKSLKCSTLGWLQRQ